MFYLSALIRRMAQTIAGLTFNRNGLPRWALCSFVRMGGRRNMLKRLWVGRC
ncbi:MAG: hypothetical protein ACTS44_00770 [Candidatus Hodgkinia cicadicola]